MHYLTYQLKHNFQIVFRMLPSGNFLRKLFIIALSFYVVYYIFLVSYIHTQSFNAVGTGNLRLFSNFKGLSHCYSQCHVWNYKFWIRNRLQVSILKKKLYMKHNFVQFSHNAAIIDKTKRNHFSHLYFYLWDNHMIIFHYL